MIKRMVMFVIGAMIGWLGVNTLVHDNGSSPASIGGQKTGEGINVKNSSMKKNIKELSKPNVSYSAPAERKRQTAKHDTAKNDLTDIEPLNGLDFCATLDEITSTTDDRSKGVAVRSMLSLWAKRAPSEAFEWAVADIENSADPEGNASLDKHENLEMVLSRYLEQDADAAGQAIKSLPAGDMRNRLVINFVRELGVLDSPTKAEDWVESIEDPDARQQGMLAVAEIYVSEDPYSFLNFAEEKRDELNPEGDGYFLKEMMRQAAKNIGEEAILDGNPQDIVSGANELSQYPEEVRAGIAEGMILRIMDEKPETIDQLLESLPQGEFRDEAIERYVNDCYADIVADYDRLVDLAASMEDRHKMSMTAVMLLNRMQDDNNLKFNKQNDDENSIESAKVRDRLMALIVHGIL